GYRSDFLTLGEISQHRWIQELDVHLAGDVLANDDVARQEQPDRPLGLQRTLRERWVTRAEDAVGRDLAAEFFLQRGRNVDVGEHAEAFGPQCLDDAFHGFVEPHGQRSAETVLADRFVLSRRRLDWASGRTLRVDRMEQGRAGLEHFADRARLVAW